VRVIGAAATSGPARKNKYLALIKRHVIAQMLVKRGLDKSLVSIVSGGGIDPLDKTRDGNRKTRNPGVKVIVR
jgi:phospholipase/lecithinase/hemolysin